MTASWQIDYLAQTAQATDWLVTRAFRPKLAAMRADKRFSEVGQRERAMKYANGALTRGLKPRRGAEDPFRGGLATVKADLFVPGRTLLAEKRLALRAHLTEPPDPARIPWDAFVASQLMALGRDRRDDVMRGALVADDLQMQALLLRLPRFLRSEIGAQQQVHRANGTVQTPGAWDEMEEKFLTLRAPALAQEVADLETAVTKAEYALINAARDIHEAAACFEARPELVFKTADDIGFAVDSAGVLTTDMVAIVEDDE
jgi:hypothetical protein